MKAQVKKHHSKDSPQHEQILGQLEKECTLAQHLSSLDVLPAVPSSPRTAPCQAPGFIRPFAAIIKSVLL